MIPLSISAIGMVSSLGLNSVDACAAARAGLVRLREITTINTAIDPRLAKEGLDGVPLLTGHAVPVIATGCAGLAKWLALSRPALQELLQQAALTDEQLLRTGLIVALSDNYFVERYGTPDDSDTGANEEATSQAGASDNDEFLSRLCREAHVPFDQRTCHAIAGGRVAWTAALQRAAALIESGAVDRCIVGGIESCLEPHSLQAYANAGVIKTDSNPAGFIPGEAAVFMLVTHRAGSGAGLTVKSIGSANDHPYLGADAVPTGRGLTQTFIQATRAAQLEQPPAWLLLDLNGTDQRAADWGCALVHLQSQFAGYAPAGWIPALSFGETGAAMGGIATCMMFRAVQRGYALDSTALILLSADDGRRSCVVLQSSR